LQSSWFWEIITLLHAVLGEIPKISGSASNKEVSINIIVYGMPYNICPFVFSLMQVNVNGTIAYISQASWIQRGTVRDNILCGKPMDHKRLCIRKGP
jgi:ATP-binding cassette subfamily C (CFTR/MRP) protein 2